jgi:hypothetical protein
MRWILNYLLFVLIILFTWIGIKYPIDPAQRPASNVLTSIKPADVNRIRIETADGMTELSRVQNRWMLNQPIDWYANNITAERLASLAAFEYQSKLPSNQIDLSTLGLTLPRAVVSLNTQSIAFGATNQIGNRRYLLTEGEIYLISDLHYPIINLGLPALVDERLLPAGLEITRLTLPGLDMHLGQQGWSTADPSPNSEQLAQLVNRWQRSEASAIKPYQPGLTPLFRIGAETVRGSVDFFVLSIKPEIIIANPALGLQYHFPDHQYYELLALPPEN